jgi:predicted transglutaminase-like cysteine proteinase
VFWITYSSQSTKRVRKPCAKGSVVAAAAVFLTAATTINPALAAKSITLDQNATAAFAPTGVFQSIELETNATSGLANWNKAKRKLVAEAASYKACDTGSTKCPSHLRDWRDKLGQWSHLTPRAKLIQVNRFANAAIGYTDDRKAFRSADYWATPLESLKGRGDCEDYVLLKYASLRSLGFTENQLRIVIVNDLKAGIGHAVLSVKVGAENYILDNQDNRVLRHDSITRYAPVYSVNTKGRWINIATRDLKRRRVAPVVLVASNTELGDVLPAAAASHVASIVPKPIFKKLHVVALEKEQPLKFRMQAVAAISMLHQSVSVAERELEIFVKPPTVLQRWTEYLAPLVKLLSDVAA